VHNNNIYESKKFKYFNLQFVINTGALLQWFKAPTLVGTFNV
jgi:hypothetical protein